ncbi:MAG: hypothetical protein HRU20_22050 [Pseudomonadales bacterium]|nr:hypothetical protein [Pseudomonadales bacterium]
MKQEYEMRLTCYIEEVVEGSHGESIDDNSQVNINSQDLVFKRYGLMAS